MKENEKSLEEKFDDWKNFRKNNTVTFKGVYQRSGRDRFFTLDQFKINRFRLKKASEMGKHFYLEYEHEVGLYTNFGLLNEGCDYIENQVLMTYISNIIDTRNPDEFIWSQYEGTCIKLSSINELFYTIY